MALSGKKVKLQPSDDEKATVEVPIEAAHMSTTIKNMLDGMTSFSLLYLPFCVLSHFF
jgi:hypothetical protein